MILIIPVTLHAVVRQYPQLATKCHYLLGATGLAAMSYHVWMRRSRSLWCLVAAAALWMFLSLASLAMPLQRHWGHAWPSVVISRHNELLRMGITVSSRWKVEPGQYMYLWLPQAGLRTASQLPLFYISSWEDPPGPNNPRVSTVEQGEEWSQVVGTAAERDAAVHTPSLRHGSRGRTSSNTAMGHRTLRVLARPQSSALAAALYDAEHLHNIPHSALVLGPYGRPPDLGPFGIVLLIVEDVGIARVFSLIQTLVLASEQHRAMIRKLIVVWQMEDLGTTRRRTALSPVQR